MCFSFAQTSFPSHVCTLSFSADNLYLASVFSLFSPHSRFCSRRSASFMLIFSHLCLVLFLRCRIRKHRTTSMATIRIQCLRTMAIINMEPDVPAKWLPLHTTTFAALALHTTPASEVSANWGKKGKITSTKCKKSNKWWEREFIFVRCSASESRRACRALGMRAFVSLGGLIRPPLFSLHFGLPVD